MQKILLFSDASDVSSEMNLKPDAFFPGKQVDSFIGVDNYDLIAFDWYNISLSDGYSQIVLYLDKEDLFFFCGSEQVKSMIIKIIDEETKAESLDNEHLLYHFFIRLLKNDSSLLNDCETNITDVEDRLVSGSEKTELGEITAYRKKLLMLKHYYEQLALIFDELSANDNGLLSENGEKFCTILGNRTDRLFSNTVDLRDYIAQVLDVYQSQLDYRQNNLMKVFTVVTAIFLPLTLLVGWYGMNFDMPEFRSAYSYPVVIAISLIIVMSLLSVFKHKKWI